MKGTASIFTPGNPLFVSQVDDPYITVYPPVMKIERSVIDARTKTLFPPDFLRGNSFREGT
jgi:hypothetical protein